MSRLGRFSQRLHSGDLGYDFIGRRKLWFFVSLILIVISLASFGIRQLNFGVEFSGGSVFQFSAPAATEGQIRGVVRSTVAESDPEHSEVIVQSVSGGRWRVQTASLPAAAVTDVQDAIAEEVGIQADDVSQEQIGPTWGLQVSQKAGLGLLIFLGVCVVFLWAVFDWKMALAAMIALFHDLLLTAGVYSLVGFEVTPATVIGFLTILGYSLYDTVVVFDKVRENTSGILGGNRTTYSRAANLAVNQTLARSINTSVVALLPVVAILVVSTTVLGAGTLQDLSLALFAGMAAGTYSSIFIASPILAILKEREPKMAALRRRVEARESAQGGDGATKKARRAMAAATADSGAKAKPKAGPASTSDADEPDEELDDDTTAAASSGNGTVTVTTPSGSPRGEQNVARRGSQRPQPRRASSNKRKSKGRKRRS
ncbi:MAG: protein translocase subunit SecF [Streptosporangiales bacterium]|nr:protein translocase subunit SecF [Streptosporangiales bacterium]